MKTLNEHPVEVVPETLTCRVVESASVHVVLATWRQLEQRLGSGSVASGAAWTETWLDAYGSVVPHQFLIAEAAGMVRGLCLFVTGVNQKEGPCSVKTRHLGTAGEPQPGSVCVEYNRVLVENSYRDQFIAAIAEHVKGDRSWEQFRIDGFSEEDLKPWLKHFPQAAVRSRDSKYFDLQQARLSNQTVIDGLGKSTRSNLRRRLRQYGELDCEWAENAEHAGEILEELIQLHQARWQAAGEPGAFASPRFLAFQKSVAIRLFLEEKAVLFRVRHQGETVGCLFLLVDDNRLLDYLSGFASFDVKPSPGLITHYLCMETALVRGFDAYDFLVGDKRHKENLSSSVNQLCWMNCSRASWKFKAIELLRVVKQKFRKASPAAGDSGIESDTQTVNR